MGEIASCTKEMKGEIKDNMIKIENKMPVLKKDSWKNKLPPPQAKLLV